MLLCKGGRGLAGRFPVNKPTAFCKTIFVPNGLQKLCQKTDQQTKKNLQTGSGLQVCRPHNTAA
jgi:hypothetical protein